MCVLTFVPKSKNGFIITNNRDENLLRPRAISPKKYKIGNSQAYFPKDPKAGGTWIATNLKYTLCLLNGAFEKHIPAEQYTKSRGTIILDFLIHQNIDNFKKEGYFIGIENFTLIIIDGSQQKISQLVWDGSKVFFENLVWTRPYIWSSCTLYTAEIIMKRSILFEKFLKEKANPSESQLFEFHKHTEVGDMANNLVMERGDGTITQSICQITSDKTGTRFTYSDLIAQNEKSLIII